MTVIPFDAEERDHWRGDPDAYDLVEQLHDAFEALSAAADDLVNAVGIAFDPERPVAKRPSAQLIATARQRVDAGQSAWASAVAQAEELLLERHLLPDRGVSVDREQRFALLRELRTRVSSFGDFTLDFDRGNADACGRHVDLMRDALALMEAIGGDSDDVDTVRVSNADRLALSETARRFADELAASLAEAGVPVDGDVDLDALGALRRIERGE